MFNVTGPAILAAALGLGLLLVLSLVFAFRDTVRGFRDLFDLRVIRNFSRSILGYRPRFSLAFLLIAATLIPPLALVARHFAWPEFPVVALVLGYALIIVSPLVYWFIVEAFGRGPRDRWRDVVDHEHPSANEPMEPKRSSSKRRTNPDR